MAKFKRVSKSKLPKVKNPQKGCIEVYHSAAASGDKGTFRWRLKASNGRVIAVAGEAYVKKASAFASAAKMLDFDLTEVTLKEEVVEAEEPAIPPQPEPAPTPAKPARVIVGIASPGADATLRGQVDVVVDAFSEADVKSVELFLDTVSYGVQTEPVDGRYRFSVATINHPNGKHLLRAHAEDRAGNQADSPDVTVAISN